MRQDERESLSHIMQSIDEHEIFSEFISKSKSIKDAWQISEIFESKKTEFINHIKKYEAFIEKKEKELSLVTKEILEANALLEEANKELENIKEQLVEMQNKAKFYKNKINQGKTIKESILEMQMIEMPGNSDIHDLLNISSLIREFQPLSIVDVHVRDGNIARARVAQRVYSENLYDNYKKSNLRLMKLKDKIVELELANSKLEIELRDFEYENNFKENLLSKINSSQLGKNTESSITIDGEDSKKEDIKQEIDSKKEDIREIITGLKSVFEEEGIEDKNTNINKS